MLYELIATQHGDIVARTRARLRDRPSPSDPNRDLAHGVPLFLTQLAETLRLEATPTPFSGEAIGSSATRHGAELLAAGFNVSQVVHDYGDICQVITELAAEQEKAISAAEFHTLNRCLDTAIAEAVTEHARLTSQRRSDAEVERLGQAAHELRDLLAAARLAFHVLERETAAVKGAAGSVLNRSLANLQNLVDRTLAEVRLAADLQRRERLSVSEFLDDLAASGVLHADDRHIQFIVAPVDAALAVEADPHLLASAVMNLLQNAFKNTRAGGTVVLRAHARDERLLVEVQDQCGGIPENKQDLFKTFGNRRATTRSGLGLGLSIARQAVRAHGGEIRVRNLPGEGCIFTVDLPLAPEAISLSQSL